MERRLVLVGERERSWSWLHFQIKDDDYSVVRHRSCSFLVGVEVVFHNWL